LICLIRSQLDYLHLLTSRHQHRQDHQEGGAPRDPGARGLRDEGGGEVAKLPNLQLPALSLLSDQDGGLGVGPQEPGLVPLLPTPGELVDVITDHQSHVESCGDGTVHEVGNPASPAIPLTRIELGAVSRVRHQVFLWVPRYARTNFVIKDIPVQTICVLLLTFCVALLTHEE